MSSSDHSSDSEDEMKTSNSPDTSPTANEDEAKKSTSSDSGQEPNDSDDDSDDSDDESGEKDSKEKLLESSDEDSDQEPTDDGEDFKPKEIKKEIWLKKGWPAHIPTPSMVAIEKFLQQWKKGHKNALPGPADFCKGLNVQSDEDTEIFMFELVLGKRNTEGKLNQQGQKGSLRSLWKEQFPKSKRDKGGLSFSAIENEEMLPVEQTYLPLLEKAVANMTKRAEGCDKGHMPKAKLAAWRSRLEKTRQSLQKREEAEKRIKEARASAVTKSRSKKSLADIEERVNKKAEALAVERIQQHKLDFKQRVHKLVEEGMAFDEAMDKAMGM
jgi:hypothetical protein